MAAVTASTGLAYISDERAFVEEHEDTYSSHFYIVDAEWFRRWASYVRHLGPSPGPISNSRLLTAGLKPKRGLQPARDYRGVCEKVWVYLLQRHGGGPEIRAQFVNIYRPDVTIFDNRDSAVSDAGTSSRNSGSSRGSKEHESSKVPASVAVRRWLFSPLKAAGCKDKAPRRGTAKPNVDKHDESSSEMSDSTVEVMFDSDIYASEPLSASSTGTGKRTICV
mmetsp:Transcript_43997/g.80393  ORF Transcript_43997/g.80393 Transcript_43997/m.80393 type:complete len:222 (-) Transcript_43997:240-905(-)